MRVCMWYNNHEIRIEEVPTPQPGPREMLVKVMSCGICGSDVVEWYRLPRAPLVPGHELGAEVVELGLAGGVEVGVVAVAPAVEDVGDVVLGGGLALVVEGKAVVGHVVEPDLVGRGAAGEEEDGGGDAGVGFEDAAGHGEDAVEAVVLDILEDLGRELEMAVLYISHNLGVIARICDRVGVMYFGSLVEQGRCADLFARPRHPYTGLLLKSAPRIDDTAAMAGQPEQVGELPNPFRPPAATAFIALFVALIRWILLVPVRVALWLFGDRATRALGRPVELRISTLIMASARY